jgi:predicted RND superfamily exporter protein
MGLVAWFHIIFGLELSFISLMGLIMIYGMSVDYGIFATDIDRRTLNIFGNDAGKNRGVWTSIFLAAFTTVAGFLPLDFCRHPVLIDLGRTLTLGMIGTLLGTFWGVPFALVRLKRKNLS